MKGYLSDRGAFGAAPTTRARLGKLVLGAAIALVSATGGAAFALCTHFARRIVTPALRPNEDVTVLSVDVARHTVWLQGTHADLPGRYSFISDAGASHARLGEVIDRAKTTGRSHSSDHSRVARKIVSIERGQLLAGARGRITGWWYTDPAELGFTSKLVTLPLEGGASWAWLIEPTERSAKPGSKKKPSSNTNHWAVHVHGRGALPEETLRGVSAFAKAGITNLVIAYRNDPGAPSGILGRYGLGIAEQRDVDAAIDWARQRGATRVTLDGYSMGGTAVVLAATRGPHRDIIDGLVLDSPALDWPAILKQQAKLAHVPVWVARVGERILQSGFVRGAIHGKHGTDLASLTPDALAVGLRVPVLIHASPQDTFVPWEGARRFAQLLPELVTLRESAGEHVKLWNTDPEGWEVSTEAFLARLREL